MAAEAADSRVAWSADLDRTRLAGLALATLPTLLVAGALCAITFLAGGGLNLSARTPVEMVLTLVCGVGIAVAIVLAPPGRPLYGLWPAGLLLGLAGLSALSVIWSVQPDGSWQDAGRLFAYSALFALAVLLARALPAGWSAILGGVLLAAVIVCGYALLTKIFPNAVGGEHGAGHTYARLQAPYGYWNAIGLAAAMGAIGCMWLGARRAGHALLNALAYPAMGLLLVTLMLAYSRGALAALVLGTALWLCIVPLRLRGVAVLGAGALGAAVVVGWDFSQHALTADDMPLAERMSAGHQLGVLLAAVLVLLTLVGVAIGFFTNRRALSPQMRKRAGTALLALPVIVVIALLGALTVSHRGLFGSISHTVGTLTNPNATLPANGPGRLTAIGSVRARYWNEALEIFKDHPLAGVGAEGYETARLRYRTAPIDVGQAHGFVVQTLADLGLLGLLLVLALFFTWLAAAGRATHPLNRRWRGWPQLLTGKRPAWLALPAGDPARAYSAERVGLLSIVCVTVTFGVHSFVDWTWYVPGVACAALLCAGWVAGRGPLTAPPAAGRRWRTLTLRDLDPLRGAIAAAVVVCALLAAWAQWQPQHSVDAADEALALVARSPTVALATAHTAIGRDPLSAEALLTLAAVQEGAGQQAAAAATYERAVHLQPANFHTWQALGEYDLQHGQPQAALQALRAAVYLNPEAVAPRVEIADNAELLSIQNSYLQALRDTAGGGGTAVR
ncbi:MAG TPA: O-antigen ligase family protein [Solirubrobacteraceae bacterium]|jgi:O-antigen ligase|nr:O-antigen ligase family protein [Solirubrobacteraceae bacterium]